MGRVALFHQFGRLSVGDGRDGRLVVTIDADQRWNDLEETLDDADARFMAHVILDWLEEKERQGDANK